LLAGPLVRRGDLREIQERWQQASSEIEKKAWARQIELALRHDPKLSNALESSSSVEYKSRTSADATREV